MKTLNEKDFNSFKLKPGMVVQLISDNKPITKQDRIKNPSVSNMLIAESGGKLLAIEIYWKEEEPVIDEYTGNSYCFINFKQYPHTLGINPIFGDHINAIYKQLGIIEDNQIIVVHEENGLLLKRL